MASKADRLQWQINSQKRLQEEVERLQAKIDKDPGVELTREEQALIDEGRVVMKGGSKSNTSSGKPKLSQT